MNFCRKMPLIAALALSLLLVRVQPAVACPDIDGLLDLNCDERLEIICFGDSITFGTADSTGFGYPGRLNQIFPNAIIRNFGDPGEKTPQGTSRAATLFAAHPNADFIVILEGVNDYWLSYSANNTKNNLLSMVGSGQATSAITLLGKLTAVKRNFQKPWVSSVNGVIDPFDQVDFFSLGESIISSDLLHPDAAGYVTMAEYLADILEFQTELNRPVDADADGIYDFAEAQYGTSTALADSDSDGVLDGAEIFIYKSNPLLTDSDSDGISDGDEVAIGANPASALPTPPVAQSLQAILPES